MVSFQENFILGVRDFSNTFVTCGRSETTSVVPHPLLHPGLSGLERELEDSICGKYGEWVDLARFNDIKPARVFMYLVHARILLPVY
jgi:hypothetical protein